MPLELHRVRYECHSKLNALAMLCGCVGFFELSLHRPTLSSCRQTTIYTVSDCVLGLWASLHRVPLQEKEPGMRVFVYSLIASKSSTVTTSLYK